MKKSLLLILFLFSISFTIAFENSNDAVYNYLYNDGQAIVPGFNYTINVNHSQFSDYATLAANSILFNDYSLFNYMNGYVRAANLVCFLTGGSDCEMTGDLNTTGDIEAESFTLNEVTITNWDNHWLKNSGSTGLIAGGELSVNVDDTKIDIAAGETYFIDSYTDPFNPTTTKISWSNQSALSPTYLGIAPIEYVSVYKNGTFIFSLTVPEEGDRRDTNFIGSIIHDVPPFTTIRTTATVPGWTQDLALTFLDSIQVLGPTLSKNGNIYSANGTNQKIDKSAGTAYGVGYNYDGDKKNPNFKTIERQEEITFPMLWRGSPSANVELRNTIPTDKYDPNGDGILVDLPENFWTIHRIYLDPSSETTIVQYGQNKYDSLKKAAGSFDKEQHEKLIEVSNVLARASVIVKSGSTDLSDPSTTKFVNLGVIGDKNFKVIPSFARFAEPVETIDSLSYQRQNITILDDSGTIYMDIEAIGGGDITYVFGQREYILDSTNGSGINGKARVALTTGTADVPIKNWVFAVRNGADFASLNSSITEPEGEHAMVGTVILPDLVSFQNDDSYGSRRWTQAKEIDGVGIIPTMLKKLRGLPSDYKSGLTPVLTIESVPSPDKINFTISSGVIREIYDQTTDALTLSTDGALVVNDETTAYTKITDLNEIITDALGGSLLQNNHYYQIVVAISTNTNGKTRLLINKPSGSYTTASEAFNDVNSYSVTTFPDEFETVSLVAAFVLRYQATAGGTYTNAATEFGVDFIDLRNQAPGSASQGSGSAAVTEFSDGAFSLFNSIDATKIGTFDISNITTGNIRTIFWPDRNLDLNEPIFEAVISQYFTLNGSTIDDWSDVNQSVNLTPYWKSDGTSTAMGNWDLGTYDLETKGNLALGSRSDSSDTTLRIKSSDNYVAQVLCYSDSEGIANMFIGQAEDFGGGMSYNGDGTPVFVTGETKDHITFYRNDDDVKTAVFDYSRSNNTVNYHGDMNLNLNTITNVADPEDNQDAATMKYVDDNAENSSWNESHANNLYLEDNSNIELDEYNITGEHYKAPPMYLTFKMYDKDGTDMQIETADTDVDNPIFLDYLAVGSSGTLIWLTGAEAGNTATYQYIGNYAWGGPGFPVISGLGGDHSGATDGDLFKIYVGTNTSIDYRGVTANWFHGNGDFLEFTNTFLTANYTTSDVEFTKDFYANKHSIGRKLLLTYATHDGDTQAFYEDFNPNPLPPGPQSGSGIIRTGTYAGDTFEYEYVGSGGWTQYDYLIISSGYHLLTDGDIVEIDFGNYTELIEGLLSSNVNLEIQTYEDLTLNANNISILNFNINDNGDDVIFTTENNGEYHFKNSTGYTEGHMHDLILHTFNESENPLEMFTKDTEYYDTYDLIDDLDNPISTITCEIINNPERCFSTDNPYNPEECIPAKEFEVCSEVITYNQILLKGQSSGKLIEDLKGAMTDLNTNIDVQENLTTMKTSILANHYITNTTKDPQTLTKVENFYNTLQSKSYQDMKDMILTPEGKLSDNVLFDYEKSNYGSYNLEGIGHTNRALSVLMLWKIAQLEKENEELKDKQQQQLDCWDKTTQNEIVTCMRLIE